MGLGTLFNLLLQDSDYCSKNLSRWLNPISRDAHSNHSFAESVPKTPSRRHGKSMFPSPETLSSRLGYQAFHMLGSHWLLNYRIRIIRVHLQRLDNLPPMPYILPSPPRLPRQWRLLKFAALFVAFCLWINKDRLTVTQTLSITHIWLPVK